MEDIKMSNAVSLSERNFWVRHMQEITIADMVKQKVLELNVALEVAENTGMCVHITLQCYPKYQLKLHSIGKHIHYFNEL